MKVRVFAIYVLIAALALLDIVAWAWAFVQGVHIMPEVAAIDPTYPQKWSFPLYDQIWWLWTPPTVIILSLVWPGGLLWKGRRGGAIKVQLFCLALLFVYFLRIGEGIDGT